MIVAGFGFREGASADSLQNALRKLFDGDIAVVATAEDKAVLEAFRDFATGLDATVIAVAAELLEQQSTQTTSQASITSRNVGSVAEAAALAAAGQGATLMGPRVVSDDHMATCAIAKGTMA